MKKLGKSIGASLLLVGGFSILAETAFAQPVSLPAGEAVECHEILGQTREQLIGRLGREKKGNSRESLWEMDREQQSGRKTLWVVYDREQKAVLCRFSSEGGFFSRELEKDFQ